MHCLPTSPFDYGIVTSVKVWQVVHLLILPTSPFDYGIVTSVKRGILFTFRRCRSFYLFFQQTNFTIRWPFIQLFFQKILLSKKIFDTSLSPPFRIKWLKQHWQIKMFSMLEDTFFDEYWFHSWWVLVTVYNSKNQTSFF